MSDTSLLVSVITPVFNCERFIGQAIESILVQTYKNFEYIIIDDASTDMTLTVIKKFLKADKRIKLIENKKNLGAFASYNIGLSVAKGQYIAFQDSDDISDKERLMKQKAYLDDNIEDAMVGTNIAIIDKDGKIIGARKYRKTYSDIIRVVGSQSPFANPTVLIRKVILDDVGQFNLRYVAAADYDLWLRILKKYKASNLSENLVFYRISLNQSKRVKLKTQLKETIDLIQKYAYSNKYFNIRNIYFLIIYNILLIFPNAIILFLFEKTYYKKAIS